MEEAKKTVKAIKMVGICDHCGESIETVLSKRLIKALFKAVKETSGVKAELTLERILGRDEVGNYRF